MQRTHSVKHIQMSLAIGLFHGELVSPSGVLAEHGGFVGAPFVTVEGVVSFHDQGVVHTLLAPHLHLVGTATRTWARAIINTTVMHSFPHYCHLLIHTAVLLISLLLKHHVKGPQVLIVKLLIVTML